MSLEVWVPEGVVEPRPATVVGGRRHAEHAFPYKWFSVDIYNDGPDPVYPFINEYTARRQPLNAGDSFKVNMRAPRISVVYFECDPGKTANIRMYGKR